MNISHFSDEKLIEVLFSLPASRTGELGCAKRLIERCGSLPALLNAEPGWLAQQEGVGFKKSLRLIAAQELMQRATLFKLKQKSIFSCKPSIKEYLIERLQYQTQEKFLVVLVDGRHRLLQVQELFHGGADRVLVCPRAVLRYALLHHSQHFLVAHNHPSASLEPSEEDFEMTDALSKAAKLLGLTLLDHMIVAGARVISFAEQGWLLGEME